MRKKRGLVAIVCTLCLVALPAFAQWKYNAVRNTMTDQADQYAWVMSKNKQKFSFPYAGGTSARLGIRQKGDASIDVYMGIDRGQFLCNDECEVSVRLDDAEAEVWRAGPSNDGSPKIIFFWGTHRDYLDLSKANATLKMVEKLAAAKRVRISATFYQEGDRVFEFPTTGLKWPLQKTPK